MGISRSVRPAVLLAGVVQRTRELRKKSDQSVYGHEVVVAQESGAQAAFTMYIGQNGPVAPVPSVGEFATAECTIEESRDFGATLVYESAGHALLDQIHSALSVAASGSGK